MIYFPQVGLEVSVYLLRYCLKGFFIGSSKSGGGISASLLSRTAFAAADSKVMRKIDFVRFIL